MLSCFMASPDCARARAPNSIMVDISFTTIFFMNTSPLVGLLWIRRPDSAGPGMRCVDRMKVTEFLWPEIEADQRKKAAIRFSPMAAIKEARGKLDLRKVNNQTLFTRAI